MRTLTPAKRKQIATARTRKLSAVLTSAGINPSVITDSRLRTGATVTVIESEVSPEAVAGVLHAADLPTGLEINAFTQHVKVVWPFPSDL